MQGNTTILLGLAALFITAALAIGVAAVIMYRRPRRLVPRSPAQAPTVPVNSARGMGMVSTGSGNLPVDTDFDEEEMPTVIVNQPPRPRPAPSGGRARPQRRATPARSSGATIIAFDDEDDD